jgi:hypothetical protein
MSKEWILLAQWTCEVNVKRSFIKIINILYNTSGFTPAGSIILMEPGHIIKQKY